MILLLTDRGISVSFVTTSPLIANPTPASLLSPSDLPLQKEEYSKSLRLPDSEKGGGDVDDVFGKFHCYYVSF